MKRLYFVRHGESVLNQHRLYAGQINTPLTEQGRQQAHMAGYKTTITFDLIVSSPLIRAWETAQIIAREIGYPPERILTNSLFMERSLGSLEGRPWDEASEDEALFPDIESEAALLTRAAAGLAYLRTLEADTILLASHGSLAKALRASLDSRDTIRDYTEPPNAQIVQLI
ncbi:MAG TPA: histidine phosphatase family protein [Verrucomicrobiae bacterium]|nr:histidine phosphatase family protein [Verrucomicrobiae bacterium]